ncbi:MAG: 2OG-Fe(II) oxygenase [Woeseiaceae bacterium]
MLNPELNTGDLATQFAEDDRLRIENLFDADVAERMREACRNDVPWEYLSFLDGQNVIVPAADFEALQPAQLQEFHQKLAHGASKGVGFFYCGYKIQRAQTDSQNKNLQFLHSIFNYLNSDEMLQFVMDVTGRDDLKSADAQFTRYTPGQFLTRHRDDPKAEERRIAYVISLTKNWHPDWGGLLQFYEEDGTTRDTWAPKFNSISLFDVHHIHSVSYVTPFAMEQRLSLTGWFRAM